VLGDPEKMEVVALKRGGGIKRTLSQQLKLEAPKASGKIAMEKINISLISRGIRFSLTH